MPENTTVINKEALGPDDLAAILELNNQQQKLKSKTNHLKAYMVSVFFLLLDFSILLSISSSENEVLMTEMRQSFALSWLMFQ